jgi:hypothetical protein
MKEKYCPTNNKPYNTQKPETPAPRLSKKYSGSTNAWVTHPPA